MSDTVELNYIGAVNQALHDAMEADPTVITFGEDVGKPGGVFGATRGLQSKFGNRVFDTPISEAAILGAALGSSLFGLRPVAEIMWIDFSLVALDQLVNQAANTRYVSNGSLNAPMTVRTQQGALPGSCAQHSQCLEALFAHIPGLRLCLPSNPQDAYDMLRLAIECNDPAVVIESRGFYFGPRVPVQLNAHHQSGFGKAATLRSGTDISIFTWGTAVNACEAASHALEADGVAVDLVDLRWLSPLDIDAIVASVRRTGHAIVVHEANVTGGFGAEVAAAATEAAFADLIAPIRRIGVPNLRIPAAPSLQAAILPNPEQLRGVALEILRHS